MMRRATALLAAIAIWCSAASTARAQETPEPAPSPSATPTLTPAPLLTPSPSPTPSGPLAVTPQAANLHPSQSAVLTVTNATGIISATADAPLAQIAVDQNARSVTLTAGTQTGRTVLHIFDETGTRVDVPLRVALDAARLLAQNVTLRVTGTVDPTWLGRQLQSAVARNVQLMPGVTLPPVTLQPPALSPGGIAAIPVTFTVAGGDQYYDVPVAINVNVQSLDVPPFEPPLLFYDDDRNASPQPDYSIAAASIRQRRCACTTITKTRTIRIGSSSCFRTAVRRRLPFSSSIAPPVRTSTS